MYFDPMYFMFMLPAILLALWAQFRVKSAYAEASQMRVASGFSGAQAAQQILRSNGLDNVEVEMTQGYLSDHYDPRAKVLRLSPDVYQGRSIAAVGIAAHEAGHALQDAKGYAPLAIRNFIVPVAGFGSNMSFFFIFLGAVMSSFNMIILGILLFSTVVFFQLVNLPVEFDASNRAKAILLKSGLVSPAEQAAVAKVLSAAAMTYVAATISAVLTLVYYLVRFGVIGRRSD